MRRIDLSDNSVTTLAGSLTQSAGLADGVGTLATFFYPNSITMDSTGSVALIVSGQRRADKQKRTMADEHAAPLVDLLCSDADGP